MATPVIVSAMEAATSQAERQGGHSDVDAMGQDKHRSVIGHAYGPSKARQFAYYAVFVAFIAALYFGAKIAVDELDKAPTHNAAKAPWAQPDAPQRAPQKFQ